MQLALIFYFTLFLSLVKSQNNCLTSGLCTCPTPDSCICNAGYYQSVQNGGLPPNAVNRICTPCDAGTFSSKTGAYAGECNICINGTYSQSGASSCTSCPAGTYSYNLTGGATSCTSCNNGTFSLFENSTSCSTCSTCTPSFFYQEPCTTTKDTVCKACPAGSLSFGIESTTCQCIPSTPTSLTIPIIDSNGVVTSCCPINATYENGKCQCKQNFAQSTIGSLLTCTPCEPGWFSSAGASTCTKCPAGSSTSGPYGECVPCLLGATYSVEPGGATSCSICTFETILISQPTCNPAEYYVEKCTLTTNAYCNRHPTRTPSPTATSSMTSTQSSSSSPLATKSSTITTSVSASASTSASALPSYPTETPSASGSSSASHSPLASYPTNSATGSASALASFPTYSATRSATVSATSSETGTSSSSITQSVSSRPTVSSTISPTSSVSSRPSQTSTITSTVSGTSSQTISSSATISSSSSPSQTISSSPTSSVSGTSSQTISSSPTSSSSSSPSLTASISVSGSAAPTNTPSMSGTVTSSASASSLATSSGTTSSTSTHTGSNTPTPSPTATPSATPSVTATLPSSIVKFGFSISAPWGRGNKGTLSLFSGISSFKSLKALDTNLSAFFTPHQAFITSLSQMSAPDGSWLGLTLPTVPDLNRRLRSVVTPSSFSLARQLVSFRDIDIWNMTVHVLVRSMIPINGINPFELVINKVMDPNFSRNLSTALQPALIVVAEETGVSNSDLILSVPIDNSPTNPNVPKLATTAISSSSPSAPPPRTIAVYQDVSGQAKEEANRILAISLGILLPLLVLTIGFAIRYRRLHAHVSTLHSEVSDLHAEALSKINTLTTTMNPLRENIKSGSSSSSKKGSTGKVSGVSTGGNGETVSSTKKSKKSPSSSSSSGSKSQISSGQQQQSLSISPAEVSKRGIGQQQISPSSSKVSTTPSLLERSKQHKADLAIREVMSSSKSSRMQFLESD
jgi:hypothetical protein